MGNRLTKPQLKGESDKAPLGFLDLPPELRLRIYKYAITSPTNPVNDYLDWHKGLILSCKTIYYEIEHELVQNTNKHLITMKETWDEDFPQAPLHISSPSTMGDVQRNISVSIPHSWIRKRCVTAAENHNLDEAVDSLYRIPRSFTWLLPLHVSHLTLKTHEDESAPFVQFQFFEYYGAGVFQGFLDMLDRSRAPPSLVLMDGRVWDDKLSCDSLTFSSDLTYRTVEEMRRIRRGKKVDPPGRLITHYTLSEDEYVSFLRGDGAVYERNYASIEEWQDEYRYEIEDVFDTDGELIGFIWHRLADTPRTVLLDNIKYRTEPMRASDLRAIYPFTIRHWE